MMKKAIQFLLFTLIIQVSFAQTIEDALFDMPGVRFEKAEKSTNANPIYELRIKQPIDHQNPDKGHFFQRVFLTHKGFDSPTVLITEGYARAKNRVYELSTMLNANQIDVEHRYYGASIPEDMDYAYLTLEQAAADMHNINQLFKTIYKNKWVSTGISKGGQTTIFYRYFYPHDVDVSVPYVAPLNLTMEDKRIYEFLSTVGTKECRDKIYDHQVRMLKNRDEVLKMLKWYSKGADLKFEYLSLAEAFEFGVLEYPFSFWQWGSDCDSIPTGKVSLDKDLEHFLAVSGISFFSDRDMDRFSSHYYQAASQMGYYGYETKDFKGLLKALPMSPNPNATFTPKKMPVNYDGTVPNKVAEWLKTNGNQFLYIYGANDTWSATGIQPSKSVDAHWFFMKGKSHGDARIKNMTAEEKSTFVKALEEWLDVKVN